MMEILTGQLSKCQLKEYAFPTEPIPRYHYLDERVITLIDGKKPVIVTGSRLVEPALKWTKLDYLLNNIGEGLFNVYEAPDHVFKYFDDKKATPSTFEPHMKQLKMKFAEFYEKISKPSGKYRYYLQQQLNDTVGSEIVQDFVGFNWKWITDHQARNRWGPLTSNLLLISQEGNLTPCHYDEQENFFSQVGGVKRVFLFAPDQYSYLYPHPVQHPHDRQSQVNFEKPDYTKYPRFKEVRGYEALLEAGDVLYLPSYWFHHFETLEGHGHATSITFWFKSAAVGQVVYPLTACQKMAMMRNIEKMVGEALNNPLEIAPFFEQLALGRYTDDLRTS